MIDFRTGSKKIPTHQKTSHKKIISRDLTRFYVTNSRDVIFINEKKTVSTPLGTIFKSQPLFPQPTLFSLSTPQSRNFT